MHDDGVGQACAHRNSSANALKGKPADNYIINIIIIILVMYERGTVINAYSISHQSLST